MLKDTQEKYNPLLEKEELNTDIFLNHPSNDKTKVIQEITDIYPEESFCFLNIGKLREQISLLKEYFLPNSPYARIAYAVKANPRKKILETLKEEGINTFDCASQKEIETVLQICPEAKILFNNPIKREKDIKYAAQNNVLHFTAQSRQEIQKILKNISPFTFIPSVEIAVRLQTLNPKAKVNLSTKYGAIKKDAKIMLQAIKQQAGFAPGISIHTGSQNTDLQSFAKGIRKMTNLAKEEGQIKTLNIGGGLPINYFENETNNIRIYLKHISKIIEENLPNNLNKNPEIIIELGRAIIAEAVDLVIPILAVEKRNNQKCIYFNDGIFTSFSDAAVHGWEYNFKTQGKNGRALSKNQEKSILFGRTCDSGDSLGEVTLPENVDEGDAIHIENAGAYLDCQSSYFNGFEPPKYVIYN